MTVKLESSLRSLPTQRVEYHVLSYTSGSLQEADPFWPEAKIYRDLVDLYPSQSLDEVLGGQIALRFKTVDQIQRAAEVERVFVAAGTPAPGFGSARWKVARTLAINECSIAILLFLLDKGPSTLETIAGELGLTAQREVGIVISLVSAALVSVEESSVRLTARGANIARHLRSQLEGDN